MFVMDDNSNVNGLHSELGFHREARYEFKVHFDGADFETLTYRASFGEADSDGTAGAASAYPGRRSGARRCRGRRPGAGRQDRQDVASAGGTRLWAGRIADSFYIDLSLLAIIDEAVANGTAPDLSGWRPDNAKNSFADTFVESIVLEVTHAAPPATARYQGRGVVRHQACHRQGRLAADQPGRAPDDVADLLADRHRFLQPGEHQAPVRRRQRRRQVHRRAGRRGRGGHRDLRRPPRDTVRPWPGNCSPTCCPTWSARPRPTASPAATAGHRPTTPQRPCSPGDEHGRALRTQAGRGQAVAGRHLPLRSAGCDHRRCGHRFYCHPVEQGLLQPGPDPRHPDHSAPTCPARLVDGSRVLPIDACGARTHELIAGSEYVAVDGAGPRPLLDPRRRGQTPTWSRSSANEAA